MTQFYSGVSRKGYSQFFDPLTEGQDFPVSLRDQLRQSVLPEDEEWRSEPIRQ